jgi:transcriptional regulator with PAS, ATPase and Fis domain
MVQPVGHTLTEDSQGARDSDRLPAADSLILLLEGDRPTASSGRYSLAETRTVVLGRGAARQVVRPARRRIADLQIEIPDPRMSTNHAVLSRSGASWIFTDSSSRNGSRINGKSLSQKELEDGDLVEMGRSVFLFRRQASAHDDADLDLEAHAGDPFRTFSPTFAGELEKLRKLANAREISILIQGESGTGKELLARRIAEWAGFSGDFVAVNCGALPASLLEGELFGAVRGAYSGATSDRLGLIRSADRGCLFLDEIAELAHNSQAALLRVLQEGEVLPVGATRPIPVALRVLSATHQNLDHAVEAGRFRHDLLSRIAGFRVHLPPLRARREDIGILISSILARDTSDVSGVRLTPDVVRSFYHHDWPLNVRELGNALKTAILLAQGEVVSSDHLRDLLVPKSQRQRSVIPADLTPEQASQRDELAALLARHGGNVSAVARELGKARMQVQRWMKRYNLTSEHYR